MTDAFTTAEDRLFDNHTPSIDWLEERAPAPVDLGTSL